MQRTTFLKTVGAAATALVLASTLAACGSSNAGGDTTCGDYKAMDSAGKKAVISEFLKSEGKDPSNLEISATQVSATAFCSTLGTDSSTIREVNG